MSTTQDRNERRRFTRAAALGGGLGAAVFFWMATAGTFDPFRWQLLGDFYDAQAHSLLRGELAIDPDVLGIEAFRGRHGATYMYQGPVPALLRLPASLLFGDRIDGRMTVPSMLGALAVMLVFASRLHWAARSIVRGGAAVSRAEAWIVGLVTFVLAAGSPFLYEASRPWVYHEALVWGAALALASLDQLLAYLLRGSPGALARCSALTAATLLARVSIGLAPLAGLGLVAASKVVARLTARRSDRMPRHSTALWAPAVAAAVPLCAYAAINLAKFGRPFGIPFLGQRFSEFDPARQAMLAANDGTLFGIQFVPTTVLHYFRPDRIRFTRLFPFVDFPPFPAPLVGDAVFDLVDRTAALPCVAPLLLLLGVVGLGHALLPRAWRDPTLHPMRVLVLAAAAGGATVLPFGYISHRYLCDFVPFLAIAGALGVQALLHGWPELRRRPRGTGLVVPVAFGALAAASVWINAGLALRYQRQWSANIDPRTLAGFVGFQVDVNDALGHDPLPVERVAIDADLPGGSGRPGTLLVAGDCDALYISDGTATNSLKVTAWNGLERTAAAGHHRFRAIVEARPPGTIAPIFSGGTPSDPEGLLLEYLGEDRVRLKYHTSSGLGRIWRPVRVRFGHEYDLDLFADWRVNRISVRLGDATVLESFFRYRGPLVFDRNEVFPGVEPSFAGRLERRAVGTPLCERLVAAARSAHRLRSRPA
jgi:hypothetical protein